MLQKLWKAKWIITTILCFLLLYLLPSTFIEKYYSNNFYQFIRKLLDNTFGRLSFPAYYIMLLTLFLIIIKWIITFFKENSNSFIKKIFKIISFSAFVITFFFVLWGFNYGRIPLESKLKLVADTINIQQLEEETITTIQHLSAIRLKIKNDTTTIPQIIFLNDTEDNSRTALNTTLAQLNYSYSSKIRGRFLINDMLLIFGIGGQYMPFTGEANVDNAIYYSKKPFYLIHEFAHGNGFTQEAECNFLAYVSCVNSTNLSLQYSGELNYLLYLFAELKYQDIKRYNQIFDNLPLALQKDMIDIKQYMQQHTFKLGIIGDVINNIYLKILGIKDGVKNYDKMVLLIYAWKHSSNKNITK